MGNFEMQEVKLISISAAICLEYPYSFIFTFTVRNFEKRNEQTPHDNPACGSTTQLQCQTK